jgi:hypothetical protein
VLQRSQVQNKKETCLEHVENRVFCFIPILKVETNENNKEDVQKKTSEENNSIKLGLSKKSL